MGVFLEPCAPPVSFCFWTMWGVRGGGLALVFWSQNHRYAGHTSGRVSGNLPWGRQKLERKATDSGHLLIRQVAWGSEVAEASPGQAG